MPVERRGQVTDVGSEPTGNRRSSNSRREAAAFVRWHEPDDARVSSPDLVYFQGLRQRALRTGAESRKCEGRLWMISRRRAADNVLAARPRAG
jgi:hypothetical protein